MPDLVDIQDPVSFLQGLVQFCADPFPSEGPLPIRVIAEALPLLLGTCPAQREHELPSGLVGKDWMEEALRRDDLALDEAEVGVVLGRDGVGSSQSGPGGGPLDTQSI